MKRFIFLMILILQFFAISVFSQVSQEWVKRFTSDSTRNESVNDMFVDAQGNIYVTGSQRQTNLNLDIQAVTVKYNSQGVQQWIQNYVSQDNNGAFTRAIYVDAAENVYVTGETEIYSGGANQALIIKYSPTGTQLWSYRFQYVNLFYAGGFDIITDATGNVYVTGEYGNGGNNIFLIKLDSDGNLVNQTSYSVGGDGGRKIALDGTGKIIVGGYVSDNDSLSFIALKYEQNLDLVWATRYGQGIGNQNKISMTVDNNSNIILAGTDGTTIDYTTVKINPVGNVLWSKNFNSTDGWDKCAGVVIDDLGNIYVTGETGTAGLPFSYKMTTIKYAPNGDELWVRDYDSSNAAKGYRAYDIAIDNNANTYIIGQSSDADIVTIKYDSGGMFDWAINYNGLSNSLDIPIAVGMDPAGNIYSTGNSFDNASGYDIVTIKYIQSPTTVNYESEYPLSFSLKQNYPNPFNPTTTIKYSIPNVGTGFALSTVMLKVYDVLGNEVAVLVNEEKPVGSYEVNFNASKLTSGVYFYKLQAGNYIETKKMIILK